MPRRSPMSPEERLADIAALKALDRIKWAALIRHHEDMLKKENKK